LKNDFATAQERRTTVGGLISGKGNPGTTRARPAALLLLALGCCLAVPAAQQEAVPGPAKILSVELGGGVKLDLVLIRPGSFMMGSDKGYDNAKPVHQVTITKPFYIGKYEVTQQQWQAVMGSNPSNFKGPTNPVDTVSWDDCQAYIKKLNEKSPGAGFRLPTEAEWEYACRAGGTTQFCYGNYGDEEAILGEYAWYSANSEGKTHPVGEKKPNAWGLYDMHGNVWEWCADWFADKYPDGPVNDPTGPSSGQSRVIRGGYWYSYAYNCRSANRDFDGPDNRFTYLGFRFVRTQK
jgi:formylglycine-generating enzyme required for sulfatase activity